MQQPIFKRQFFAFDAISGCSCRAGLENRITRWLLVILSESELWILVQEAKDLNVESDVDHDLHICCLDRSVDKHRSDQTFAFSSYSYDL